MDNKPKTEKTVKTEPKKRASKKMAKVVDCELLNVRKEASMTAAVLEVVEKDSIMEVIEKLGDWTNVVTPSGIKGFCVSAFIR